MARPEAGLWDYLRGLLPTEIHYSRIESETCPGFPDIHYTLEGCSGTIELKCGGKGKHPFSGKNGLRKTQQHWIRDQVAAGGYVLLLLEAKPDIYLLKADCYYDDLHRMTLNEIALVSVIVWRRGDHISDLLAAALIP